MHQTVAHPVRIVWKNVWSVPLILSQGIVGVSATTSYSKFLGKRRSFELLLCLFLSLKMASSRERTFTASQVWRLLDEDSDVSSDIELRWKYGTFVSVVTTSIYNPMPWHAMCDVCLTLTVMRLRTFCHFFCHSYSASVTVQCRAMTTCKFRVAHTISASNKRLLQFIWSLVIRPTYFAKPKAIFVFTITSDVRGMSIATT